jgi:hypothetical protein
MCFIWDSNFMTVDNIVLPHPVAHHLFIPVTFKKQVARWLTKGITS